MRGSYLLSGLVVFGAAFTLFVHQSVPRETPRPRAPKASSEVPMALLWSSDPRRSEGWNLLAETQGVDARARAFAGDWDWFETAAELQDPFFVAGERRECNELYGSAIEGRCSYTLHYVAEPLGEGTGRIVHVRASLRDSDSMPAANIPNDPGCGNYIGCLAHARLGATVPLPVETPGAEIAFHEHVQSVWGDPILFDPERLPKLIETWKADRRYWAALKAKGEVNEGQDALKFRFIKSLVPYLEQHLRRVQEMVDEDG